MVQEPDKHSQSADALKAIVEGSHKPQAGSEDGFVGPEDPEDAEDGDSEEGADEPIVAVVSPGQPAPYEMVAAPADGPQASPAGASRIQRAAAFEQRARLAHAHQYKTVMIPLLITMGAILLLMGLFAVIRGSGGEVEVTDEADSSMAFQKWFPLLAFPLGAILLLGAWLFHRDVNRHKK